MEFPPEVPAGEDCGTLVIGGDGAAGCVARWERPASESGAAAAGAAAGVLSAAGASVAGGWMLRPVAWSRCRVHRGLEVGDGLRDDGGREGGLGVFQRRSRRRWQRERCPPGAGRGGWRACSSVYWPRLFSSATLAATCSGVGVGTGRPMPTRRSRASSTCGAAECSSTTLR